MNKILDDYYIEKNLGSGSFGDVYLVIDKKTKEKWAAKVEDKKKSYRLVDEYKIYKRMHRKGYGYGLPKIHDFIETPKFNILLMELLSDNLDKLFVDSRKKFNLETVLLLGVSITELLEKMHNMGYIHRDIKPNNFMVGFGNNRNKIFIMDLGLAKRYVHDGKHISMRTDKSLTGTARYVSTNVHMGFEPSRRDDLISVGYMLVYFLKGSLPWQGIRKDKKKPNHMDIGEAKLATNLDKLCKDTPECFKHYLHYCKNLMFDQKPDYKYLKSLFVETAQKMRINLKYEWS